MKRAALSAPSLVIAPASRIGLLAITPTARPSIRASAVTISGAKASRRKLTEPSSASPVDRGADVVGASAALGDHLAQERLVGLAPLRQRPLEVGDQPLRRRDRLGLVGDRDVDDPVRRLDGERADRVGLERAQTAALDHRRAAHAQRGALGGDDQVGGPGEHRVAREAPAGDDRDPAARRPRAAPRARRRGCRGPRRPRSRCRPDGRRRPRPAARSAGACARSARTGGPSCGARSRPGCRRARCSRRRGPRRRRARRAARR